MWWRRDLSPSPLLFKRAHAQEQYAANWMISILCFQFVRRRVEGELAADCSSEMRNKTKVMVVTCRVRLHAADDALAKINRFELIAEQQFIGAVRIFNAPPDVIAFGESPGGLGQVAVPNQAFRAAIAAPNQRAGPIAARKWAVVHNRGRHAVDIFVWMQHLRAG